VALLLGKNWKRGNTKYYTTRDHKVGRGVQASGFNDEGGTKDNIRERRGVKPTDYPKRLERTGFIRRTFAFMKGGENSELTKRKRVD